MLKLANFMEPGSHHPIWVYITPRSIEWMMRWASCTEIRSGGNSFRVIETPEQILAMDEMQYELYPMVKLNSDGSVSKVK
jgi:hypothetical protein